MARGRQASNSLEMEQQDADAVQRRRAETVGWRGGGTDQAETGIGSERKRRGSERGRGREGARERGSERATLAFRGHLVVTS